MPHNHVSFVTCIPWFMMTSSNEKKKIPRYWLFVMGIHRSPMNSPHKASDAELWCFLWFGPGQTVEKGSRRRWFETTSRSLWRHCRTLMTPNHNKTQQKEPSAYNIWDLVYSTSLVTTGEHVTVGRYHSGRGLSQWETTLHCNVVSHWLSPCAEWYLSQAPL